MKKILLSIIITLLCFPANADLTLSNGTNTNVTKTGVGGNVSVNLNTSPHVTGTLTADGAVYGSAFYGDGSHLSGVSTDTSNLVPKTTTINNKPLTTNIVLGQNDIDLSLYATTESLSGYVPNSRTVNGKALSGNITLTTQDIDMTPYGRVTSLDANNIPKKITGTNLLADSAIYDVSGNIGIGNNNPGVGLTVGSPTITWTTAVSSNNDVAVAGDVEIDGALYVDGFLYGNGSKLTGIMNKTVSLTDSSTVSINSDITDIGILSTLSQDSTISNPSGSPINGQKLIIRIKSSASKVLTFGTQYRSGSDVALPSSTTGSSKTDYFGFIYNSVDSKWDITSKAMGY